MTQHKSLTLGALEIPKQYFIDFLRGLIDGDGGMQRWIHRTNGREQWNLRIASGSRKFLVWLRNKTEELIGIKGKLYSESNTQFRLKYGKIAALSILSKCYYKEALSLARKANLAQKCSLSTVVWKHSKIVFNN